MNNTNYKITFDANKKHDIIIENYTRHQKDACKEIFFAEEYDKAYDLVKDILDAWRHGRMEECLKNKKHCYEDPDSRCSRKNEYADCNGSKNENPQNNIILFSGARGTGKTSAMRSFGKFLEKEGLKNESDEKYKNRNFKLLQMIDPSYFRKNENIVVNVITVMFKMAKCIHDKRSKAAEDYNKNSFHDLLRGYEKVFNALKNMDELKHDEQSLEYLNELAETTDLRCKIHSLIEGMLDFISQGDGRCKEEHKKDIMVLMIDDLDMNLSLAPLMLEQIRKFLMVKDLIILMASNIDQLQIEMQERYGKAFRQQVKNSDERNIVQNHIEDISHKYLLKFFPPSRRILVGSMAKKLLDTRVRIILKNQDPNTKSLYDEQSLQNVVLYLIWSRTRLIFVPEDNELHPIIPTNLRELQQFVFMLLEEMENIEYKNDNIFKDKGERDKGQKNFEKFKNYILNTCIKSNVSAEEWKVFENMPLDITRINKYLIQSINVIGNQHKKRLLARDVELTQIEKNNSMIKIESDIYTMVSPNDPKFYMANKISDIYNEPSNNSMGDVLLLIDKYQTYFESVNESHFINAVKIYYSMLFFETMFFHSKILQKNTNPLENIIDIQKLIGGTVYFQHYFDIITSFYYKAELSEEFDKGRGNHLFYHQYNIEDLSKNLLSCFYISYYGYKRPERALGVHVFDTTRKIENAEFDILSLLSNILNPYHTIERAKFATDKSEQLKADIQGWLEKIPSTDNEVNKESYYPNFILPIYSVDLMLKYLRRQFDFENISSKISVTAVMAQAEFLKKIKTKIRKEKTIEEHDVKKMFEEVKRKIDETFKLLEKEIENEDKENGNKKKALEVEKNNAENTLQLVEGNALRAKDGLLLKNFEIIKLANIAQGKTFKPKTFDEFRLLENELFPENKNLTSSVVEVNFAGAECIFDLEVYKCQVVGLLIKHYVTNTREREQKLQKMIQEIQKKKSKAEIMFYLVSELWEKEFQISIIHEYMQQQVRDFGFIAKYYDELWDNITSEAFKHIDLCKRNEIINKKIDITGVINITGTDIEGKGIILKEESRTVEQTNNNEIGEICKIYQNIFKTGKNIFIPIEKQKDEGTESKTKKNTKQKSKK